MATGQARETTPAPTAAAPDGDDMLLRVENLVKHFPIKGTGLFREKEQVHAVDGVSLVSAAGTDVRHSRRDRVRQVHPGPVHRQAA